LCSELNKDKVILQFSQKSFA